MKKLMASTAFVLFFLAGFTAHAATFRILTYAEWSALAPAKRAQYVRGLREMLVEIESRDSKLGLAAEPSSAQVRGAIALLMNAMASAEADEAPASHPDVATTSPEAFTSPSPEAPADVSCTPPKFECSSLNAAQNSQRVRQFRADHSPDSNLCISGGFFSKYANDKKIKGQCQIVTSFPANSSQPKFQCKVGEALCNPLVFCTKNGDNTPAFHCEPYGPRDGYDITERCNRWYAAQSPEKTCDASNMNLNGVHEAWDELASALQKNYQARCENGGGFQSLFCGECQAVAERAYKLNKSVLNLQCKKAEPTPARPEPSPSPTPKPKPAPKPSPTPREPGGVSCAQEKMISSAKRTFNRLYSGHPNSSGGYCGQGVGNIILGAGLSFARSGRNAINYMQLAPKYGFEKLNITDPADAPPGAILVFSGPCSRGYSHPEGAIGCSSNGDTYGHVTVKGDDGHYYTDGRTVRPAIKHRYLVGVFVPGPSLNAKCEGR